LLSNSSMGSSSIESITELREILILSIKYTEQADESVEFFSPQTVFDRVLSNKSDRQEVRLLLYEAAKRVAASARSEGNRILEVKGLNAIAVFGHDLVFDVNGDRKLSLLQEVLSTLLRLRNLVSLASIDYVDEMLAGSYYTLGIVYSDSGNLEAAIGYFEQAISIFDSSDSTNTFHQLQPLQAAARAACALNLFDKGLSYFHRLFEMHKNILTDEQQLKEDHLLFASTLIARANCIISAELETSIAVADLELAGKILSYHPENVDNLIDLFKNAVKQLELLIGRSPLLISLHEDEEDSFYFLTTRNMFDPAIGPIIANFSKWMQEYDETLSRSKTSVVKSVNSLFGDSETKERIKLKDDLNQNVASGITRLLYKRKRRKRRNED